MYGISLAITALEPLVITDGSAESMAHQTLEYIPGNMILGAFASRWVAKNGKPGSLNDAQPAFRTLFLDGTTLWGNAYPCIGKSACVPVPKSYAKLKNYSGLPSNNAEAAQNPLVINKFCLEEGALPQLCKAHSTKIQDESPRLGRIGATFMEPLTLQVPEQPAQWNMHVALDQNRRSAADGQLFGFSSLATGNTFLADIYFHTEEAMNTAKALFASVKSFRVGHSRSAGYGLVAVEATERAVVTPQVCGAGRVVLYLLSDYLPKNTWESPLKSLENEVAKAAGRSSIALEANSVMASYKTVAGFNSLWRLPKTSRTVLEKGSILAFTLPSSVSFTLPPALGGGQGEGYGRICVNPAYLEGPTVSCGTLQQQDKVPLSQALTASIGPMLAIMRNRSLQRQARNRATDIAWRDEKISKFITIFDGRLRQSQRSTIRHLVSETTKKEWDTFFDGMAKTTKSRWENSESYHPGKEYRDSLFNIMRWFLSDQFLETWNEDIFRGIALPGPALTEEEKKEFLTLFHREFLLHLLQAWEKAVRAKGGQDA